MNQVPCMLKFFRKIRQGLLAESKFSKYMLYATGEIVLVVIGILIALQINNWNDARKLENRELVLLEELKLNLETNQVNLERDIAVQIEGALHIDSLLYHLDHQLPYDPSFSRHIQHGDFAPDVILTSSAFETLKSSGLELIRSDSLRRQIIELFEVTYPYLMQETRRLEDQVWPAVVVPMLQKYLRSNTEGIPMPVDYNEMLNDKEFANMWSRRRMMRNGSTRQKQIAAEKTEEVILALEAELKVRQKL